MVACPKIVQHMEAKSGTKRIQSLPMNDNLVQESGVFSVCRADTESEHCTFSCLGHWGVALV